MRLKYGYLTLLLLISCGKTDDPSNSNLLVAANSCQVKLENNDLAVCTSSKSYYAGSQEINAEEFTELKVGLTELFSEACDETISEIQNDGYLLENGSNEFSDRNISCPAGYTRSCNYSFSDPFSVISFTFYYYPAANSTGMSEAEFVTGCTEDGGSVN